MRLQDKVVLLTGAASGMGECHARRIVAEGGQLLMTDIAEAAGQALAAKLGERALFVTQDIADEAQWQRVAELASERFGGVDVLVNNAGILTKGAIGDESPETLRKVLDVNVVGTWMGIRAISPLMIARGGGSIVNISSQVGYRGWTDYSVYGCSKWAIRGLTKHLALELASHNIRVNAILPGAVDETGLFSGRVDETLRTKVQESIPLGRFVTREQVSSLLVFLASDESGSTTGTDNLIDGGVSI
ncbi:glucose 1-dehydrogenase [Mangrovimicrobium sediminis]|uniref:Glucose 1-dehydrogenase n=1 Tax=Mangrovimicrobium sediminis TaxID=2562682 RepID=A0A4Z0LVN5_9GAMM|nr:glucose 1-dehydrogenase [Haliea sp. SAOS-164]TGD71294.1 glucose 1-dehydrogenase [Haliea sp. SAOS-164]